MRILRWMSSVRRKHKIRNEYIMMKLDVTPIGSLIATMAVLVIASILKKKLINEIF